MKTPGSLEELIESYKLSSAWGVLAENTKACYTSMEGFILKHFKHIPVFYTYNLAAREQADFIFKYMGEVGLPNQRRNQLRAHINVLWQWAVVHHGAAPECNPTIFMPILRHEPREGSPFTKEEAYKVDGLLKSKDYKGKSVLSESEVVVCWMVKLLFETGMRPSEAINLNYTDIIVDGEDTLLQIIGAKGREENKLSRYVSVTPGVRGCIDWAMKFRYSRKNLSTDSLFVTVTGKRPRFIFISKLFRGLMKLIGMEEKQLYDLRRGAATAIIHDPRYGITVAQKQLGHKNIQQTMRYENLNKKEAAKLFKGYE